jgi:aspartyl-tRNA(Asn)/glutamyl-tRNA(Gln) amidotransferase subunit A
MAGADPHDSTAANLPVPDYLAEMEKGVRGLKIGLSPDYFRITYMDSNGSLTEQPLPAAILQKVYDAAERLAAQGAEIVEGIAMPHTKFGIPAYFVISRVEAASNLHRYDGVKYGYRSPERSGDLRSLYRKSRAEGFGAQPKLRILMGMYVSAAQYSEQYYNRALKIRSLIRQDFDQAFTQVDALLTPSTPSPAFRMGGVFGDSVLMQYADQLLVTGNHAGVPGISLPAGLDEAGLPLGIHFFAPDYREDTLFRLGYAYEQATAAEAWRKVKPAL